MRIYTYSRSREMMVVVGYTGHVGSFGVGRVQLSQRLFGQHGIA